MSWVQSDINISSSNSYVPCEWSTGTDAEIVEAVQKHYAGEVDLRLYWSVGDERTISLSAMEALSPLTDTQPAQDVIFVLSNVGGKTLADGETECAFQVDLKGILYRTGKIHGTTNTGYNWNECRRRDWCNSTYYNAIPSTIRPIFKEFLNQTLISPSSTTAIETTDYFSLRAEVEVLGVASTSSTSKSEEGKWIDWYKISSNRIKTTSSGRWWLRSCNTNPGAYSTINSSGQIEGSLCTNSENISPFGVI